MSIEIQQKYEELKALLGKLPGLVVAFSAGVDSTLVLAAAADALGNRVVAVTGRSASVPEEEIRQAGQIAASLGVEHVLVDTCELDDEAYAANPPDRCFHCKSHLFAALGRIAAERGGWAVADGSNADDEGDYRPGLEAAHAAGVISPLRRLGIGKEAVRELARWRGLSNWDKPAAACLASRIPFGSRITAERLHRVEMAERILHELGFSVARVRDHDDLARIEVDREKLPELLELVRRGDFVGRMKGLGYRFVTADLEGYRSGSMNPPGRTRGARD